MTTLITELSVQAKEKAVENMTANLAVLRTMLHLSQEELATLIGVGRQTLVAVENRKRKMTWSVFLSLLFVFSQNEKTNSLLDILGIYTEEMKKTYKDIANS